MRRIVRRAGLFALPSIAQNQEETKSVVGRSEVSPVTQAHSSAADKNATNFLLTKSNTLRRRFIQPDKSSRKCEEPPLAWIFQTDVKESLETSPIVVDASCL